jgi:hypothetical protein
VTGKCHSRSPRAMFMQNLARLAQFADRNSHGGGFKAVSSQTRADEPNGPLLRWFLIAIPACGGSPNARKKAKASSDVTATLAPWSPAD